MAERGRQKVLILGGSSEGYALADALAGRDDVEPVTSFAGATRTRRAPQGAARVGGFGGAEGLAAHLAREGFAALIDATHPFAETMSRNAAMASARVGLPFVHVVRPPWTSGADDLWIDAADMDAAAAAIPSAASPTFLTVGRTEIAAFASRADIAFLARVIDPPETPTGIARLELVFDRGPFDLELERNFLRRRGVRCLVTKNSGGEAARPKLDAARELGLPVVMIRRPAPPDGEVVAGIAAAVAWLEAMLGLGGASPPYAEPAHGAEADGAR